MRLEITLVRVGELGYVTAVLEARDRMAHDKRLLQRRIECARKNPVRDVVAGHHVEPRVRINSHHAQMAGAEERDESGVSSPAVDPAGEGIPAAGGDNAGADQTERSFTPAVREQDFCNALRKRVSVCMSG
jgi:hypothetical protein